LRREIKKRQLNKSYFAVSFSGEILNQNKLKYLKLKYDIKILEDNAHTLGAKLTYSDISIFSFHPIKHITTGEGGAIVTNDKDLYNKIKRLRNHDQDDKHNMIELGYNYRLSYTNCTLRLIQIKKLNIFIQKRQDIAKRYEQAFKNTVIKPLYPFTINFVYHLFVVLVDFDKLILHIKS
jgi:dTDP-4-amino-4,6-dideoxygalactose transaminase